MSLSQAHSDAARQNGALSQGPVTAQGKAHSSQNAHKHNLLGSTRLLTGEDRAEYEAIAQAFLVEYQPATATERYCVSEMIDAVFRLQRVRSYAATIQENRMAAISETPDMDVAAQAFDQLANEGPSLALLLRYESQFRRQFDKSLQTLLDLRRRRQLEQRSKKNAAAKAMEKAIHDYVMAPLPGLEETPEDDEEIDAEQDDNSCDINFPNEPSSHLSSTSHLPLRRSTRAR